MYNAYTATQCGISSTYSYLILGKTAGGPFPAHCPSLCGMEVRQCTTAKGYSECCVQNAAEYSTGFPSIPENPF